MSDPYYERLTPLDASFLALENPNVPMHVGALATFEAAPLTKQDGTLDIERIQRALQVALGKHPRMRRKVWWRTGAPPVWIDDPEFRLSYHLRHTALPRPGTIRQLKRMAGRVLSQNLDPSKPLWEIWIVEGLDGGRFALLAKLHHCLADGISAREILTSYLDPEPRKEPPAPAPWQPRAAPSLARLHLDEAKRRATAPVQLMAEAKRALGEADLRELGRGASGLLGALSGLTARIAKTPLNRRLGSHRRVDCTRSDFAAVKALAKLAGAKVNDVVLACVAGALRPFLLERGQPIDDLDFRVLVPVSIRSQDESDALGNRVSNLILPLPLAESSPRRRLQRIVETTAQLKASPQTQIPELLAHVADHMGLFVPRFLAQRSARNLLVSHMVVTNIPGPMVPMYLLESRMLECFPFVPLIDGQRLGVALYSYDQSMHWGLQADWDSVPDLHDFALAIDAELDRLAQSFAPITLVPPQRQKRRQTRSSGGSDARA